MKPIHLCVVCFNRYDLLGDLFASLNESTVQPHRVYVIDRGDNPQGVQEAADRWRHHDDTLVPVELAGQSLPAAWNWFIQHVPEERILASDDITFRPNGLEMFVNTPGAVVGIDDGRSSHFACFLIRDYCVEKVGLFDEELSPNYMYFEDWDIAHRMKLVGLSVEGVKNAADHDPGGSWRKKTNEQQAEHHPKFILATENYRKKWGTVVQGEEAQYAYQA